MDTIADFSTIATLSGYEFESACRYHTQYAYLGDHIGLCKILTRAKIHVDTRDVGVTPHLIMDGFWETWLTQCLSGIVKPGNVCLDIGANFGYYSVLMSNLAGANGSVLAVEPNAALCKLLRRTSSIASHNFKVAEVALSDIAGEAQLSIHDGYLGNSSLIDRKDQGFTDVTTMSVRMTTLDALAEQYGLTKIDVVKIDVEGLEPQIFRGMAKTLADNPDIKIVVEYSPHLYTDPGQFTDFLFEKFTVTRIKDVESPMVLTEADRHSLLHLTDHTDLLLSRKV